MVVEGNHCGLKIGALETHELEDNSGHMEKKLAGYGGLKIETDCGVTGIELCRGGVGLGDTTLNI